MGKKKKMNSLSDLAQLDFGKKKKKETLTELPYKPKKTAPAPKPEPAPEPDSEETLFMNAMQGVQTMDGNKGRQVAAAPKVDPLAPPRTDGDEKKQVDDFLRGNIEFELEYSDEYMQGFIRGIDSRISQKLKAGSLSPEANVDLHGLNSDQANDAMLFFVREAYLQGKKCILIVTGRGKNSPGGQSILKQEIQFWLTKEPLRRIVLGFCTAQPKDGGAGAIYVLLRSRKKERGKVKWDTQMNWEDL